MPTWLSGLLCWNPCTPHEGESHPPTLWGPEAAGICLYPQSLHPHLVKGRNQKTLLLTSEANQGKRDDAAPSKEKQADTSLSFIWLDYLERALANYQHPSVVKSTQTTSLQLQSPLQLFFLSVYSFHLWHTNNMKLEHSAAPMLDFRGETVILKEKEAAAKTLCGISGALL